MVLGLSTNVRSSPCEDIRDSIPLFVCSFTLFSFLVCVYPKFNLIRFLVLCWCSDQHVYGRGSALGGLKVCFFFLRPVNSNIPENSALHIRPGRYISAIGGKPSYRVNIVILWCLVHTVWYRKSRTWERMRTYLFPSNWNYLVVVECKNDMRMAHWSKLILRVYHLMTRCKHRRGQSVAIWLNLNFVSWWIS